MTPTATWKRRTARVMTRHAARILRPTRPEWSEALGSEVEHIPDDLQALIWAAGCVRASYVEGYFRRYFGFLAAAVIGVAFAILGETVTGVLAAQPWPRWYVQFAKAHRHLGLELWLIVGSSVPSTLLAAGFGVLLKRLTRKSSIGLPWLALSVWFVYGVGSDVYSSVVICNCPVSTLWESWVHSWVQFPASNMAAILMPAAALVLVFHMTAHPRT
jgi:hypothetical protein